MGLGLAADGAAALIVQLILCHCPIGETILAIRIDDVGLGLAADGAAADIGLLILGQFPSAKILLGAIAMDCVDFFLTADGTATDIVQCILGQFPFTEAILAIGIHIVDLLLAADGAMANEFHLILTQLPLTKVFLGAVGIDDMGMDCVADQTVTDITGFILGLGPGIAGILGAILPYRMLPHVAAQGAISSVLGHILREGPRIQRICIAIAADYMDLLVEAEGATMHQIAVFAGQIPLAILVLANFGIFLHNASQEQPAGIQNQQILLCEQIVLGVGIPPAHQIAITIQHFIQIRGQGVHTVDRVYHTEVCVHTSGEILLMDGIAILIIGVICHFTRQQQLLDGNAIVHTTQINEDHGAINGIQVIVTILTQHKLIDARQIQPNILTVDHFRSGIGQLGYGGTNEFIHHAIRHTENSDNGVSHIVSGINANHIGLTQFGNLKGVNIVFHTGGIFHRLGHSLPVLHLGADLVGINLVGTGLGGLKYKIL